MRDIGSKDFEATETEKRDVTAKYGFKLDFGLISLIFLIICTAYVLATHH